jgi:hypothetical protein
MKKLSISDGRKFGRWRIIGPATNNRHRQRRVKALCECGVSRVVTLTTLRSGRSQSCGCLRREAASRVCIKRNTTHGHSRSPTYRTWSHIIGRCCNPSDKNYTAYGGRGIRICDRWRSSFEAFLEDMGPRPSPKHSIDRIDNDGDYTPENCQWATPKQQSRNRRSSRRITIDDESKTLAEWSEQSGNDRTTISRRILAGWSADRAVFEPVKESN